MSEEKHKPAVVIHVSDSYSVVINNGSEQGVKQGDTYLIYGLGPELNDPETGESLGRLEVVRGRAEVSHIQDKVATLESCEFEKIPGRRKIITRELGGGLLGLSLAQPQKEEIEEDPERRRRELNAKVGDLAKILGSK